MNICCKCHWNPCSDRRKIASRKIGEIETWAQNNNLTLNRTKTMELVCVDIRRKRQVSLPPSVPGISWVASWKIIAVTISNHLILCQNIYNTLSALVHKLSTSWKSSEHTAWL